MAPGLLYGGTPADFAVAQGATTDILDENGDPVEPDPTGNPGVFAQGTTALLPLDAVTFQVYDGVGGTQVTELYSYPEQDEITEITSATDYDERATFPLFFGPDTHEGDLYASADGATFYRLSPATDTLFTRLGAIESMEATDLEDWSDTAPSDGDVPRWNESTGEYEPTAGIAPVVLDDLADVDTSGVADGQRLAYNASTDSWEPVDPVGSHTHDGSDITSGTVDVARLPVGPNAWQVAAGNHTHGISGVSGLQTALDAKVNVADVAKVHPVIGAEDPTPPGAVDGDIIVRRQA